MKTNRNGWRATLLALFWFLMAERPAQAYLDPGSGSLLLQGIVAAFFAVLLAVKIYWKKIRARLRRFLPGNPPARKEQ